MREKLLQKGFSAEALGAAVDSLKRSGLVNDRLFARLWITSRIKRPIGPARLRRELRNKGVDSVFIEEALAQATEDYDEKGTIRELIRRRLRNMQGLEEEKKKARLFGYLVRRGFPQGLVIETILEEI